MPNIKSAEKRVEIGERNAMRNRSNKTALKNVLKKFSSDPSSTELFTAAVSRVDRSVTKGVIHKNKANRKKAQLARAAAAASDKA